MPATGRARRGARAVHPGVAADLGRRGVPLAIGLAAAEHLIRSAATANSGGSVSKNPRDVFAAQLDAIVAEYEDARRRSQHDDASDVISNTKAVEMVTCAHAAIERVSGRNSVYGRQAEVIVSQKIHEWAKLWHLVGVAQSLSHDLKAGYLTSLEEFIHGEIFGDFLEMAAYLLENGYKDAAAVIAGSTLEAHLKPLCKRAGLASDVNTSSGTRPKKADQLNAELSKAAV
jgi:hypothetical protein